MNLKHIDFNHSVDGMENMAQFFCEQLAIVRAGLNWIHALITVAENLPCDADHLCALFHQECQSFLFVWSQSVEMFILHVGSCLGKLLELQELDDDGCARSHLTVARYVGSHATIEKIGLLRSVSSE